MNRERIGFYYKLTQVEPLLVDSDAKVWVEVDFEYNDYGHRYTYKVFTGPNEVDITSLMNIEELAGIETFTNIKIDNQINL